MKKETRSWLWNAVAEGSANFFERESVFDIKLAPLMEKLIRKTFDIRAGEGPRVFLMMSYIFLIISTLLIIKPVSSSLFLSKFGVSQLPNAFILVAIFAAVVSALYSRLLGKMPLNVMIIRTLQIVIACLFIFRGLLFFNRLEGGALYVFYVWVAIFAVISASQFWVLANVIFNAREAKRLFGLMGAGAIAGGIFGGYLTNFLAPVVGSENLLLICILFISLCILIAKEVWKKNIEEEAGAKFQQEELPDKAAGHPIKLIRSSRLLTYLAGLVGISVLAAKLVDYQFSAIATAKISNEDELTAFFGFWLSNLNIVSLFIQLFLTRRVVGVFGVGVSLFFLPAGIFIGALAVLLFPALWSAVLLKISDGSLKQSINKAGMELLALPVPTEIKNQAKTFIDVFVDSFATGIGGILLAFFTVGLDFSVRQVSLISIILVAGWIYVVRQIRREYIESFRLTIEREKDVARETRIDLSNESVFGGLIKVLETGEKARVLPVLRMVKEIQSPRLIPCFKRLIHHPSDAVRLEVLENIYFYKNDNFMEDVKALVSDPDEEIKSRAIAYLFRHAPEEPLEIIREYLRDKDYRIRGAALLAAARESRKNRELKNTFRIKELVEENVKKIPLVTDDAESEFININCAKVIGAVNDPALYPYLHIFLNSALPEVLKAAIAAAAQTGCQEFIPVLVKHLANKQVTRQARQALASFGLEIIDILAVYLEEPKISRNIRLNIPKVIASVGVQKSVDVLTRNLYQNDAGIRYEVIRALNHLRKNFPHLKFDQQPILKQIFDESKNYMDTLAILYAQTRASAPGGKQGGSDVIANTRRKLIKALEERLDHNLERIFRLLGLKYPPDDIYSAYLGIQKSNEPDLRANAVEFLDNLLEPGLKRIIIPIAESTMPETLADNVLKKFDLHIPSEFDCFTALLGGNDPRLKICVLELIALLKNEQYIPYIGSLVDSEDEKVREKAQFVLRELGILKKFPGK